MSTQTPLFPTPDACPHCGAVAHRCNGDRDNGMTVCDRTQRLVSWPSGKRETDVVQTTTVQVRNPEYTDPESLTREEYEAGGYDHREWLEYAKLITCVTVYAVTRHYTRGWDGGGWENVYEMVCSVPLVRAGDRKEAEEVQAFLDPRFEDEGDIYSVRGGVEYVSCFEAQAGENGTDWGRPVH